MPFSKVQWFLHVFALDSLEPEINTAPDSPTGLWRLLYGSTSWDPQTK